MCSSNSLKAVDHPAGIQHRAEAGDCQHEVTTWESSSVTLQSPTGALESPFSRFSSPGIQKTAKERRTQSRVIQIIPSNNPKNQSKAGKKNCKVSLETVGRDGEGRRAQQHEQNRGIQFTAAPPLQIFGLSLCLCGNSLAEERCPCAKEPSQPPSPMVDLCVLEIETDSTKMLSYYKSSLQLMEYSLFHFIINYYLSYCS